MKLLLLLSLLLPLSSQAVALDVELPNFVNQEEYVNNLLIEYPLHEGLYYEIAGDKLVILGDGNYSETWEGRNKAESDYQTEQNAMVAVGGAALLGGAYLYLKDEKVTA